MNHHFAAQVAGATARARTRRGDEAELVPAPRRPPPRPTPRRAAAHYSPESGAPTARLPAVDGAAAGGDDASIAPPFDDDASLCPSLPPPREAVKANVPGRRSTTPVAHCLDVRRKPVGSPSKRGARRHPRRPSPERSERRRQLDAARELGLDVDGDAFRRSGREATPGISPLASARDDVDACLKALRSSSVVSVVEPPGPKFPSLAAPPPPTFGSFAAPPPPKRVTSLEAMTDENLDASHLFV